MTELNRIDAELRSYYRDREAQYGLTSQGIGYRSAEVQSTIFRQIARVIEEPSGFSIADVGCGFGHFFDFLHANGFSQFRYFGYDMLPDMIEKARGMHGGTDAHFQPIAAADEIGDADYVVAAGIFNVKYSLPECDWLAYMLRTMHTMHAKSRIGFAFNALTKYSDKERMSPELFYSDPGFLFDYCKRNFSRNVALLHDYTLYDFTILVRKRLG